MIECKSLTKKFEDILAADEIDLVVPDGKISGLVGTNGAGKSTLMRLIAGVLKPDRGEVNADGKRIWENPEVKQEIMFLPDEPWYFSTAGIEDMMRWTEASYPKFDEEKCRKICGGFELDMKKPIRDFSKGMRRQVSIALGISAGTKYLLCDETFDGLDPVARQAVKGLIAGEVADRGMVPLISTHNLRELEDFCDMITITNQGKILISEDLDELRDRTHKVQFVPEDEATTDKLLNELDTVITERHGSMISIVARGDGEEIMAKIRKTKPVYAETVDMSLEDIFISETEVGGYDPRKILL